MVLHLNGFLGGVCPWRGGAGTVWGLGSLVLGVRRTGPGAWVDSSIEDWVVVGREGCSLRERMRVSCLDEDVVRAVG